MKIRLFTLPFLLALMGASCAPSPRSAAVDASSLVAQPTAPRTSPAPSMPATESDNPVAASPLKQIAADKVDYSCKINADCAVKNVGSCCGAYPACVNANSPTFPNQVKAQCAKDHRMGTCNYPVVHGCECVQGKCSNLTGISSGNSVR